MCYGFGLYLGNRYKNADNIIWVAGGSMLPPAGSEGEARAHRILEGIKAAGDTHLWTAEWAHDDLSTDEIAFAASVDIQGVYTHGNYPMLGPTYGAARLGYNNAPPLPSVHPATPLAPTDASRALLCADHASTMNRLVVVRQISFRFSDLYRF